MKTILLLITLLLTPAMAGELPTITVEHLYYLQTRAKQIERLKANEVVEYCIANKIGGTLFDTLNAQIAGTIIEMTKLMKIEDLQEADARIVKIKEVQAAYKVLLHDEARRIQSGIKLEGLVATETIRAMMAARK